MEDLQQLTVNVAGPYRVQHIHGVAHAVLNMVILRTGVHPGNKGPVLYTDEELGRTQKQWNSMPLVENHPVDADGKFISARQPDILDRSGFGQVLNSGFRETRPGDAGEPGSLYAEAWVNMEQLQSVNASMAERINNNETVELSSGLVMDLVKESGVWRGQPYRYRAINYRPDHVAFLPKDKGACSVAKGCGVGTTVVVNTETETETKAATLVDVPAHNCECQDQSVGNEVSEPPRVRARPIPAYTPDGGILVGNMEVSFSDIETNLRRWVDKKRPTVFDGQGRLTKWTDLSDVYPDYFVIVEQLQNEPRSHFRLNYSVNEGGTVAVDEASLTPAMRVVSYPPLTPEQEQQVVNTNVPPTAAATPAAAPAAAVTPAAAPAPESLTVNSYIEAAPQGIREQLLDGVFAANTMRTNLVGRIMRAPGNTFSVDSLSGMRLSDVQAIAGLIQEPVALVVNTQQVPGTVPVGAVRENGVAVHNNYAGAAGAPGVTPPIGSDGIVPRPLRMREHTARS